MAGTTVVSNKADALKVAVEGTRGKVDLSKATWLDKQLVEELALAIRQRAKLKAREDDLETDKRNVTAQIEVLLDSLSLDSVLDPRSGSVTRYSQNRSNLDKSKLKEELLKSGMPAETIVRCFDKSTTFTSFTGVKFTPA